MRIVRTLTSTALATTLGAASLASFAPAQAATSGAERALKLERILEEKPPADHQVSVNAFLLKGTVLEPQLDGITVLPYVGKVMVQKKTCKKCKWKTVKKTKTSSEGKYKAKIYAPLRGRWKWRAKIKGNSTYKTMSGESWTLGFKKA